jgi:tetratricopeptide (TPR) repeat protein
LSTRSKLAFLPLVFAAASAMAQRPDNMVTVMTFRTEGQEKELGAQIADVLRERIERDFSPKQLSVQKTAIVANYLESSGFAIDDPLSPNDEQTLAQRLSADMYVSGRVEHTPAGYKVDPVLILTRDLTLRQPLPSLTTNKLDDAAKNISRAIRDAMKQLDGERKCIANYRNGKVAEAIAAANAAATAYPSATLARLCAQSIYLQQSKSAKTKADSLKYADSALVIANQILRFDSVSTLPLQVNVQMYKMKGDTTHWRASLVKLVEANPSDTKLLGEVIAEFAGAGYVRESFPLVKSLLEKQPGDPASLQLAFNVYKNAGAWPELAEVGPELIRADTAAADSSYYTAMGLAYNQLKQPQQAVEIFAEGTAKFAKSGTLWFAYSRALRDVGQLQQANEALKTAIANDPKLAPFLLVSANDFITAKQFDSAYTAIDQAVAAGAPASQAGGLALGVASKLIQEGTSSKDNAMFQLAIKYAQLSNRLAPVSTARFLEGAAAFSLLQSAATEAGNTKSCPLARTARDAYSVALPALTDVAKVTDAPQKAQATSMLQYLPQFKPAIDGQIKQFCQ